MQPSKPCLIDGFGEGRDGLRSGLLEREQSVMASDDFRKVWILKWTSFLVIESDWFSTGFNHTIPHASMLFRIYQADGKLYAVDDLKLRAGGGFPH